jgi:hypothetical protein
MLWNVWLLLALPGVWLAWYVLAFIAAIMFVEKHAALSARAELGAANRYHVPRRRLLRTPHMHV